jgi:hypothetical protein
VIGFFIEAFLSHTQLLYSEVTPVAESFCRWIIFRGQNYPQASATDRMRSQGGRVEDGEADEHASGDEA